MRLNGKLVTELKASDIEQLLDDGRVEDQYLDFKGISYSKSEGDKRELAKDVVGLANASGGVLLLGITTDGNDAAIDAPGVELEGKNDPMERYERTIIDGTEPRLTGVLIGKVPLKNGKFVIAIGVPQSLARPHWYKDGKSGRFSIRHNRNTIDMSYRELRRAFIDSGRIIDNFRNFQQQRCEELKERTPLNSGTLLVHAAPLVSDDRIIDVSDVLTRRPQDYFFPPGYEGAVQVKPNFYGLQSQSSFGPDRIGTFQLYRDGRIEGMSTRYCNETPNGRVIDERRLHEEASQSIHKYVAGLNNIGFDPPYAVSVSLLNARQSRMSDRNSGLLPEAIAAFEPVIIGAEDLGRSLHPKLRPIFDQLWNSYGIRRCYFYDDEGNLDPKGATYR